MGTQSLGSRQKKQSVAPVGNTSQMVARPQTMPVSTAPDSATESLDDGWSDESEALASAIEVKVTPKALAPSRVPDFGPLGCVHVQALDDQEEAPISRNRSGAGHHASERGAHTVAAIGTAKKSGAPEPHDGALGGRSGRPRQTTMAGGFDAPTGEVSEIHAAPSVIASGQRVPSSLPPSLEEEESAWDVPHDLVLTPARVLPVGKTAGSPEHVASDRNGGARHGRTPTQQRPALVTTGVHTIAQSIPRTLRSAAMAKKSQGAAAGSEAKPATGALRRVGPISQERSRDVTDIPPSALSATSTPVLAPAIDITIEPNFPRGSADSEARDNQGLPVGGLDSGDSPVEPALSALAWERQRVSAGRKAVLWCSGAAIVLLAAAGGWAYLGKHVPFTGGQAAVVRVQSAPVPVSKPIETPEKAVDVPEKAVPPVTTPIQEAITSQPAPLVEQPKHEDAKAKVKPRRRVTGAVNRVAPARATSTEDTARDAAPSTGSEEAAPSQPQIVGTKASEPGKEPLTAEL